MKLFTVIGSSNCRKVEAVVNDLGIQIERQYLGILDGDLAQAEYRARNPNGMVPCLTDGDFTLWESNAINQYLCDRHEGQRLLPRDPRGRADVTRWQCWELAHFNKALGTLVFETVFKPKFDMGAPNQALVDSATQSLTRFAGVLEEHVSKHKFLVGTWITIVDYAVISMEAYKDLVPFDWAPFPNVNDYFARMRLVEAWAETAPSSPDAVGRRTKAA